jgi:hypothetical protein
MRYLNWRYGILTVVALYFAVGLLIPLIPLPFGRLLFQCPLGDPCSLRVYVVTPIIGISFIFWWIYWTKGMYKERKK